MFAARTGIERPFGRISGDAHRPLAPTMPRMRYYSYLKFAGLSAILLSGAPGALAAERQDLAQLTRIVEAYVRKESVGLPGTIAFHVTPLDNRLSLPACPAPEAFMPPGGRLWGKSAVGVRCLAPVAWTVYTRVRVDVNSDYVVSARPIGQGETVRPEDLSLMRGDLARLPAGAIVDPTHAIGKQLAVSLGAGQPLRKNMLRAPRVVTQGQGVKLVTQGPGFRVSATGRALGNAADGQLVQVRGPSGKNISGIARAGGVVEVGY